MTTTRSAQPERRKRPTDPAFGAGPTYFPGIAQAACRRVDPELFFPRVAREGGLTKRQRAQIEAAKVVCGSCPVRVTCLGAALAGREAAGIWGGLTPAERRRTMHDVEALHRDVRRQVGRLTEGKRVTLSPADALPLVQKLCRESSWSIDRLAEALGVHPTALYAVYRRVLSAARASDALQRFTLGTGRDAARRQESEPSAPILPGSEPSTKLGT